MVYAKLGSKVTVVEALPQPARRWTRTASRVVERKLKKMGVEVMLDTKAKSLGGQGRPRGAHRRAQGRQDRDDRRRQDPAVGRPPAQQREPRPRRGRRRSSTSAASSSPTTSCAPTSPASTRSATSIGGMMLAHKATKEGEVVAEVIAGHKAAFDVRTIPAVVFTDPEIASTGLTEDEAQGEGPHRAQGRQVPVRRARPRAVGQRHRRLRQGRSPTPRPASCSASTSSATARAT